MSFKKKSKQSKSGGFEKALKNAKKIGDKGKQGENGENGKNTFPKKKLKLKL